VHFQRFCAGGNVFSDFADRRKIILLIIDKQRERERERINSASSQNHYLGNYYTEDLKWYLVTSAIFNPHF